MRHYKAHFDVTLIDPGAANRMLRDRIATLPKTDRAFYARYKDSEDETDNPALYDVTFGIARATRSEVESYEIRQSRI